MSEKEKTESWNFVRNMPKRADFFFSLSLSAPKLRARFLWNKFESGTNPKSAESLVWVQLVNIMTRMVARATHESHGGHEIEYATVFTFCYRLIRGPETRSVTQIGFFLDWVTSVCLLPPQQTKILLSQKPKKNSSKKGVTDKKAATWRHDFWFTWKRVMRHESVNSPSRGCGHVPFSRLCACAKSRDVVYVLRDAFGCDVRDGMVSMAVFLQPLYHVTGE